MGAIQDNINNRIAKQHEVQRKVLTNSLNDLQSKLADPSYIARAREFKCAQLNTINGCEIYFMYKGFIYDSRTNEQIVTQ